MHGHTFKKYSSQVIDLILQFDCSSGLPFSHSAVLCHPGVLPYVYTLTYTLMVGAATVWNSTKRQCPLTADHAMCITVCVHSCVHPVAMLAALIVVLAEIELEALWVE